MFVLRWNRRSYPAEYYTFSDQDAAFSKDYRDAKRFETLGDLLEAVGENSGVGFRDTEIVEIHEVSTPTYTLGRTIF